MTGPNAGRPSPYDATALPKKYGFGGNAALTFYHRLLFGTDPPAEMRRRLAGANVTTALLSSPEPQVG